MTIARLQNHLKENVKKPISGRVDRASATNAEDLGSIAGRSQLSA